ncbi:hypothetical protein [Ruthenibacterium lactatiformans]|uniref:hypothetical protein n=1 Tax=Ruthenibacterium lactatiformans TaxID=1550024 RepID=UPI0024951AD2|nr:hypothetical protein [Ruthenibacterium lactatiformans]
MYTVTRKNEIHEELAIKNLKGETELVLPVDLHIDSILAQYNRVRRILGEAQHEARQHPTDEKTLEAYGAAVVALFEVIFGSDGTKKLTDYYNGRWSEMLEDVAPFVVECIQPQVEYAMKARAKAYQRYTRR